MKTEKLSTKVRREAVRMKDAWDSAMIYLYEHKLMNKVKGAAVAMMMVWTYLCSTGLPVYAAAMSTDPKDIVGKAIGAIVAIFPFIGGFFIVAGVFKLVMAYRNNNPEDQSSAAKDIVIGAVFIGFAALWKPIGNALGLSDGDTATPSGWTSMG